MIKRAINLILVCGVCLFIFGCGMESAAVKKGDPAPDFTLVDLQGKSWTLSQLKGQVVFINFWATWCPPCLDELPSMQNLLAKLPKDRFKMLAVLNKDKPGMADFVAKQKGLTMPILDDGQNKVGSAYFLTGLPETFIVDKQGIIREKVIGGIKWDNPGAVQMIMGLINE